VSESESGLLCDPFPQGPAPEKVSQTFKILGGNIERYLSQTLGHCGALESVLQPSTIVQFGYGFAKSLAPGETGQGSES
jgi:hypothetical protein